ncbi:hydrogenase formation protein HypD [Mycoplasmatota bacterium]|nr:hydrogenase formation protein HypD [Mycoplasmatota bacterium]
MDERKLIDYINQNVKRKINIMDVCGKHTNVIKRIDLESVLSDKINLVSGPGCPICITSSQIVDLAISLAKSKKTIVTYEDMLKVRGSKNSLNDLLLDGYKIKLIKSPLDLFLFIEQNKKDEIVFLGVGFETIVPVLSSVVKTMKRLKIDNVSFLLSIKRMEPIIRKLLVENKKIDGIIAPGHVASVTGSDYFKFITDHFSLSCAICGFKAHDILSAIYFLIRHVDKPSFINLYSHFVRPLGNKKALNLINQVFDIRDSYCFGLGNVYQSSYQLKEEFSAYNAFKKYKLRLLNKNEEIKECLCKQVILGFKKPTDCRSYQSECNPTNPIGSCMVSSNGTCLAYFNYRKRRKK